MSSHPQSLYNEFSGCARCGVSGMVALEFGESEAHEIHSFPWFCAACGDVFPGSEFQYVHEIPHCPVCAGKETTTRGDGRRS